MRLSIVLRALVIAFVACAVIGEEAAIHKEKNEFQSDAAKMLDIVIRSLYVDQTVFLREIISNASDALDKIRMLYLTNPKEPKNDAGEAPTMDIRISVDKDKRTIYMRDGGVGMTKDEMKNNLGSLGSSGTQRFLEQVKDGEKLIGQFGVGFYSVFLVAERVKVASKSDDSDKQWVWESTGDGTYYTYEDPRGNTLGRGTELQLELKSDADQFLENEKLKEIVHRHSEFIHFPIFIKTTKIERVPKKKDGDAEKPTEDEAEVKDEGEADGEDADKKKEEEYDHIPVDSWELVNENKPIWTRKTSEVTEEDYNKFYKALTKDYEDPMFYTHFSVEGEVEFKSILFIPGRAPYNVFDTSVSSNNIRLYVRRVFITDEFKDLLPRYLNFVKGVVDSDDLPLVVSREQLQESRVLKIIKKKLVRKALTMFSDIAESDKRIEAAKEKKDGEESERKDAEKDAEDVATGKVLKEVTFPKLWEEFGKNLRLGLIEDGTNRARLTKLLRYKTSKSEDKLVSLQDYVDRMPESQKNIYFLSDDSIERIKQNPVLEDALKRDVEVIYMTDAIDEYVVGHVTDYSGKKLVNLAKEGISLSDRSSSEKNIAKARKAKYEPLTKWFKDLLGDKVTKVTLTQRKTSEPVILTSPQHGTTVRMHKLMQAQTLGEKATEKSPKRVMEINHLHPLVDEVFKRISVDPKDKIAEDLSLVLFDVANLQNGFPVDDTLVFGQRVGRMLRQSVDIAPDAPLLEEDVSQYETEAAEEEGDDDADGRKADEEKKDEL